MLMHEEAGAPNRRAVARLPDRDLNLARDPDVACRGNACEYR
jgi:hypothetical protein